ncbi:MAG: winged helix-turn-helix domain-containing protein [Candidatus Poribacteria bacterium]
MKVLVVEDDKKIARFIAKGLREAGFAVEHIADGEEGLYLALHGDYDVIVMDIMLPKVDGLSIIEEMRRSGISTPVLILSAKRSVDDRVKGLNIGSDDYLTKPFAFSELLARIQALLRRATGAAEPTQLVVGDLVLDLISRSVTRSGKKIELLPREIALLEYLMRNAGRVVSRTMLLEHVWGINFDPSTNVVDVHICRLRDKVDRGFLRKFIHTVRGIGYVLREEDT